MKNLADSSRKSNGGKKLEPMEISLWQRAYFKCSSIECVRIPDFLPGSALNSTLKAIKNEQDTLLTLCRLCSAAVAHIDNESNKNMRGKSHSARPGGDREIGIPCFYQVL